MKFYTKQHRYYCGIDLHARSMYLCVIDQEGEVLLHRNMPSNPQSFLKAVAPYRDNLVVAVECIFTWYWLSDLCEKENISFVLGHALYMKAVHGGKAKNDRIDSLKIASLLRGGLIPHAYVYPAPMSATRDLLRRRNHFVRKRAELLTHIQNTISQYNLPPFPKRFTYKANRVGLPEHFPDLIVRKGVEVNLELIALYDHLLNDLELTLTRTAKLHDPGAFYILRSTPGIGKILALVILYELHDIARFPTVQDFASYSRLVKCSRESAGKKYGFSGKKIGNAHLKWAFSEAAVLHLRYNPEAQKYLKKLQNKHGKAKALTILAHKLGRAVYFMLKRNQPFDMKRFMAA